MSRQFMDNAELVTKQELEAALDACVVPEERVQEIVDQNSELHDANEAQIRADVEQLRNKVAADKLELEDKIEDEADTRSRADAGLAQDIEQEAEKRRQADTDMIDKIREMKEFEEEDYPNAHCRRLKGLPVAEITVHNTDKSLHVGDTIATVDEKWFPKLAYDFWMDVEQIISGTSETYWIHCRLDNNGNVNVINMFPFAGATSASDTYTFCYITEA